SCRFRSLNVECRNARLEKRTGNIESCVFSGADDCIVRVFRDDSEGLGLCQIEADRLFQGYQTNDPNNPKSRFIIYCMITKGYVFDISPAESDSRHPLPSQRVGSRVCSITPRYAEIGTAVPEFISRRITLRRSQHFHSI